MAFDYNGALQAGYTPQEIDAYLAKQQGTSGSGQKTRAVAQPQGNFLGGLLKAAVGQSYGAIKNTMEQNSRLPNAKGNLGLSLQNAGQSVKNLANNTVLNPKLYAEQASYAVPFGRAGFAGSKALLPGAASGALSGAAQDDASLGSIGASAAGGAILPVGLQAAGNVAKGLGYAAKKVGESANNQTTALMRSQYNVSPSVSRGLELPENAREIFDKYGISNKDTAVEIAKQVTGQNGIFNKVVMDTISKLPAVQLAGVHNVAKEALSSATTIPDANSKKIYGTIMRTLNIANDGTNIVDANPMIAMKSVKDLERLAQQAVSGRNPTRQDEQEAMVYRSVAEEVKNRLYSGYTDPDTGLRYTGADELLTKGGKTPELLDQVYKINPKLGWAFENEMHTIKDLRSAQRPFVRVSKAAKEAEDDQLNKLGPTPLEVAGAGYLGMQNPILGAGAIVAKPLLNSVIAKSAMANGANSINKTLTPLGNMSQGQINPVLLQILQTLASKTGSTGVNYAGQ